MRGAYLRGEERTMEVSRCHRGKRGKGAGRGKESPEGRLSYGSDIGSGCVYARIYSCVPPALLHPLLGHSPFTPQRSLSNCPNGGGALRERASSTSALPDLATRTHFASLSSPSCLPAFHTCCQCKALGPSQLSLATPWPQGPRTS